MNTIVSDTSAQERIARVLCEAVGSNPDKMMGYANAGTEFAKPTPPYLWECRLKEADAILASLPSLSGEWVLVPRAAVDFLMGEDHWPDHPEVWFGDAHPTMRGAFWWRSAIRGMLNAAPPALALSTELGGSK